MTNDPVNFVRQGALIASALIMIQQSEVTCPKVRSKRLRFIAGQDQSFGQEAIFIGLGDLYAAIALVWNGPYCFKL